MLHCDERLAVFDKPSGLLSVPGKGPRNADCLAVRAAERFPGARIVHRLDQATSGAIVMARDAEAHRELSRQFERRAVEKVYLAVVAGRLSLDEGEIDLPMRADIENRPWQIIDHVHGRRAQTRWRVLARSDERTLLELRPLTGRSHQLRLHLQSIGHPILGDDLYAPPDVRAAAPRLLLHSTVLAFTHPGRGDRLRIEAPCPFGLDRD
ncbi:MAG: RluA family pseudouridine synthase [Phycisphaerales bacterium]|nr:RluA family pseudouridine synthase [Phycisphaerales bacterium]